MHLPGAPRLATSPHRTRVDAPSVEVLCDDAGRLGTLSYVLPDGMVCCVGDAVRVPFGSRERYGMVVGAGNAALATKPVLECFGPRAGEAEIALASSIAQEQLTSFLAVAPRLAPRTKRGNTPLDAGPVYLIAGPTAAVCGYDEPEADTPRRILAAAPGVSLVRLAAIEAERLATTHQVLILCPTKQLVAATLAEFSSGAARMDETPKGDAPSPWRGFVDGTVRVAVATRTAALWSAAAPPAVIVLDEEHPGHIEAAQPYTHARDIAVRRTALAGTPLSLLTHRPSLHALAARARLIQVGTDLHWPQVRVVRRGPLPPLERLAPPQALAAVADARRAKQAAFVLVPHTATRYRCVACKLQHEAPAASCTRCPGEVRAHGFGPDRVATLFPKATPVTFAELRTLRSRPGSTVVCFDVDLLAGAADMEPEYTLATALLAAARVAGSGGTVVCIVQNDTPVAVRDLLQRHDMRRHCKRVWNLAREANVPPFVKMVTLRYKRATPPRVPAVQGVRVLGPQRVGDEYEVRLLAPSADIALLEPYVARARRGGKVRLTVS